MPDNQQARTDPMPKGKPKRPILTSFILLMIIVAIFAVITLGE